MMNRAVGRRDPGLAAPAAFVFLALLVFNATRLTDPPYWDAAIGVYRQGVWLQRHGLDLSGLRTQAPFSAGGPRVDPFYLFAVAFGALGRVLPPSGVFLVLHLVELAAASIGLSAFHRVLRTQVSPAQAAVWIAVAATGPIWAGQTASIYLELPLIALLSLSALAFHRGRWDAAAGWSLAAYFVKSAALLQAAALAVCGVVLMAAAAREGKRFRESAGMFWLFVPFASMAALNAWAGLGASPDPLSWSSLPLNAAHFGVQAPYVFPDLMVQLALIVAGASLAGRAGLRSLLRERADARWFLLMALWTFGFWAAFVLNKRSLPRYTVLVQLPMVCLLAGLWRARPRASLAFGAVLAAWNVAGLGGRFLPPLPTVVGRSGERLERSREYLKDLDADRTLVSLLSREFPDEPLVVRWPFSQILRFPELGYVAAPRANVIDATPSPLRDEILPWKPAEMPGRRTLCVYGPNVYDYAGPTLRPRSGDEILWRDDRLPTPLILYRRTWTRADLVRPGP